MRDVGQAAVDRASMIAQQYRDRIADHATAFDPPGRGEMEAILNVFFHLLEIRDLHFTFLTALELAVFGDLKNRTGSEVVAQARELQRVANITLRLDTILDELTVLLRPPPSDPTKK